MNVGDFKNYLSTFDDDDVVFMFNQHFQSDKNRMGIEVSGINGLMPDDKKPDKIIPLVMSVFDRNEFDKSRAVKNASR